MKSATNAFEDAEIAREELPIEPGAYSGTRGSLFLLNREGKWFDQDGTPSLGHGNSPDDYLPLVRLQSPASTTAADAWDEGFDAGWDAATTYVDLVNPYRVAAPEGDGGNE